MRGRNGSVILSHSSRAMLRAVVAVFILALPFAAAIAILFVVWRRRTIWKIAGAIGAGLLCLVGFLLATIFLLAGGMCGHVDFPAIESPDGTKTAHIAEEDCGATDSFHTHVRLKRSLFFSGFQPAAFVFSMGDDPRSLDIVWASPHELIIRYPEHPHHPDEFSCRKSWGDVKITCISYPQDMPRVSPKMPPVNRGLW